MNDQKTVGINEFDSIKIEMFPNPARDKVNLRFSQLPEIGTKIILTDITGMQLTNREVQSTNEILEIQSQLAGIYLATIVSGCNLIVNKLIINDPLVLKKKCIGGIFLPPLS